MECYLHTNSIKIILRRCIIFIRFIVQLIISASPHCMFDFNIFTRNWSPTIRFDYSCRCMWNRKYTYIPILYANDRIDISHRELKSDILSHIESIPIGIILGWFCVTHSKCDPCRFGRSHGLFYHLDIMPYAYWRIEFETTDEMWIVTELVLKTKNCRSGKALNGVTVAFLIHSVESVHFRCCFICIYRCIYTDAGRSPLTLHVICIVRTRWTQRMWLVVVAFFNELISNANSGTSFNTWVPNKSVDY